MSEAGRDTDIEADGAADPQVPYAILDASLWNRFQNASDPSEYVAAWLGILLRDIHGLASGVVLAGQEPGVGPFVQLAAWPAGSQPKPDMIAAAEEAAQTNTSTVNGQDTDRRILAHPLVALGQVFGAVAVVVPKAAPKTPKIFRRIQWAASWIELLLLREQERKDGELRERVTVAFDMLATVIENPSLTEAASALVTELARRMECETVSLGFRRGRRTRVRAMSSAASFGRRTDLVRMVGHAMDEAIDQAAVILWPEPEGWDFRVSRAHHELAQSHGVGSVLTIPLVAEDEIIGALTFERRIDAAFSALDVEVCDAVAGVVGPVIEDRRVASRPLPVSVWDSLKQQAKLVLGPSHFGVKLASVILVVLFAYFSSATTDYAISSPARLEGTVQRSIVAPFNGYLASQSARAGDLVEQDQILAVLDEKDLALERLRMATSQQQRERELERAIAGRQIAEANIIRAQIEQTDAQLRLIEEQLARTRIRAPFSGYVVEGDLSQSVGASIERGQTLFQIAPLQSFRVVLEVDERDIAEIMPGQGGWLRLAAVPDRALDYEVTAITPLARQAEGRNFFRVEAVLSGTMEGLRPGMEGVARTDIATRKLFWVLTHDLADWGRLWLWRFVP